MAHLGALPHLPAPAVQPAAATLGAGRGRSLAADPAEVQHGR